MRRVWPELSRRVPLAFGALAGLAVLCAPAGAHGREHLRRRPSLHHLARAHAAIVGGRLAEENQFPSLAFVIDYQGNVALICSGTVVAPKFVLTAGHCGENVETGVVYGPSGYRVVTGTTNPFVEAHRQLSSVNRVIVFPSFNRTTLVGDASLLELTTPTTVPATTLASNLSTLAPGTAATIAGWGRTTGSQLAPTEMLNWGETVVQTPEFCELNAAPFYPESKICTIDAPSDTTGTCFGDSGGPIFAHVTAGGPLLEIGVTSTGFGECATNRPDEFTRSDLIAPWVSEWISEPAAALKHQEEDEAAAAVKKRGEEEAAKKRGEEEAAAKKHGEEEAAAKKHAEEEAALVKKRAEEEELAARHRSEEEALARKRAEEAAELKKREEAELTVKAELEAAPVQHKSRHAHKHKRAKKKKSRPRRN